MHPREGIAGSDGGQGIIHAMEEQNGLIGLRQSKLVEISEVDACAPRGIMLNHGREKRRKSMFFCDVCERGTPVEHR